MQHSALKPTLLDVRYYIGRRRIDHSVSPHVKQREKAPKHIFSLFTAVGTSLLNWEFKDGSGFDE